MKVVEIPVQACSMGDFMAADVYNSSGFMLVSKDTMINNYIKEKLMDIGIANIHIFTPSTNAGYEEFKENYRNIIVLIKKTIAGMHSSKKLDCYRMEGISGLIFESTNDNDNIIKCLSEIQKADEYTYTHCVNTAFYAMLIGKWMNLQQKEIEKLILCGLLHDIGKSKIPAEVLNKKGILTKDEYEIIKKHTILGYGMLDDLGVLDQEIRRAVLLHHERTNGSGYPFNAAADSLSLFSKVIAVADVYDAMTSERVYKKSSTPFDAFEMFSTVGTELFDSTVMNLFVKNVSPYFIGMNVELNNGKTGRIVYIPPHDILKPVVCVQPDYVEISQETGLKIVKML